MPIWEKIVIISAFVIITPLIGVIIGLVVPDGYEDDKGYNDKGV